VCQPGNAAYLPSLRLANQVAPASVDGLRSLARERRGTGYGKGESVAFDEDLAWRLRAALAAAGATVTEKKMFGGLAFLVGGNMCVAASGGGGLLARVGPEGDAAALAEPGAKAMDMGRGPMAGWITVEADAVASDEAVAAWVARSLAFTATLPSK
jgi:TfoX/Sxy family transcriptional regulator of competence genes